MAAVNNILSIGPVAVANGVAGPRGPATTRPFPAPTGPELTNDPMASLRSVKAELRSSGFFNSFGSLEANFQRLRGASMTKLIGGPILGSAMLSNALMSRGLLFDIKA